MTPEAYIAFLVSTLGFAAGYSQPGALQFVCMDWRHMWEMLAAAADGASRGRITAAGEGSIPSSAALREPRR